MSVFLIRRISWLSMSDVISMKVSLVKPRIFSICLKKILCMLMYTKTDKLTEKKQYGCFQYMHLHCLYGVALYIYGIGYLVEAWKTRRLKKHHDISFRSLVSLQSLKHSLPPEHLSSPPVFSGVPVTRSLVLYVCFVYRCLSFSTFSFGYCVVFSSSIYGFWLPLIFKPFLYKCYLNFQSVSWYAYILWKVYFVHLPQFCVFLFA